MKTCLVSEHIWLVNIWLHMLKCPTSRLEGKDWKGVFLCYTTGITHKESLHIHGCSNTQAIHTQSMHVLRLAQR